jgi:hypothetical protein
MSDLTSRSLIVLKGLLFGLIVVFSGGLLILDAPRLRTALLVAVLAWSAARLYYFLFYVLERYVDPSLRYSGLVALIRSLRASGSGRAASRGSKPGAPL